MNDIEFGMEVVDSFSNLPNLDVPQTRQRVRKEIWLTNFRLSAPECLNK